MSGKNGDVQETSFWSDSSSRHMQLGVGRHLRMMGTVVIEVDWPYMGSNQQESDFTDMSMVCLVARTQTVATQSTLDTDSLAASKLLSAVCGSSYSTDDPGGSPRTSLGPLIAVPPNEKNLI
uniref:Uncharacterized protein n=1 Tax=Steinernema glaseri TaxID=37863 RepID=A0A1I8AD27_9BILA